MKYFVYALSLMFMLCTVSCGGDGDEPNNPDGNGTSKVETFTVNGVSFNMVKVEGGTFQMGATEGQPVQTGEVWSAKNIPVHQVTLSSYSIGQTEVTAELWQAVMGSSPYSNNNEFVQAVTSKLPVVHVSWNDCITFIQKLNTLTKKKFRLPTEAEWEFAARGGNKTLGYVYSGGNDVDLVAWHYHNSSKTLHPVASKVPNELNIYDMSGNATEYCSDFYGEYSSSPQTNPQGPSSNQYMNRVERGGDAETNGPHNSFGSYAVSTRAMTNQGEPNDFKGFRLAL